MYYTKQNWLEKKANNEYQLKNTVYVSNYFLLELDFPSITQKLTTISSHTIPIWDYTI